MMIPVWRQDVAQELLFVRHCWLESTLVAQRVDGSEIRGLKEGDVCAQGSMWTALSASEVNDDKVADLFAGPEGAHALHLPLSVFEVASRQSWGDTRDRSAIVDGLRFHKDFAHLNRVQLQGLAKRAKMVQLAPSEVYRNNKTSTVLVLEVELEDARSTNIGLPCLSRRTRKRSVPMLISAGADVIQLLRDQYESTVGNFKSGIGDSLGARQQLEGKECAPACARSGCRATRAPPGWTRRTAKSRTTPSPAGSARWPRRRARRSRQARLVAQPAAELVRDAELVRLGRREQLHSRREQLRVRRGAIT